MEQNAVDPAIYPIGLFQPQPNADARQRTEWLQRMSSLPERFRACIEGLNDEQLDTPYRPGGWTIRQLAHHVVDSHLSGYIRFKWAMTEDNPVIKPYFQNLWAELPDTHMSPEVSLDMLSSMHLRWVEFLHSLSESDWQKKLQHPETGVHNLTEVLGLYAWHGDHHLGQIQGLKDRNGW